jgi:MFS transporter, ACS family, tartrate transporter
MREDLQAPGDGVIDKVSRRLLPFMFVLYVTAYLDRVNIGFAALSMNRDLGFSDAVYGLGAGIFFLGYFLFEIPSNLILERLGPRIWIARIMLTWGAISVAMAWVQSASSFYLLRFLLGVAEAGFFPGMILYLTYWFPSGRRARAVAQFMTATAVAGVVGGPVSGALLSLHGLAGLRGWQWLFILEGLPAIALGLVVLVYLTDRPEQARWLGADERAWLTAQLRAEREHMERGGRHTLWDALLSGRVWLLALTYFSFVIGLYGVSLWLPLMLQAFSGLSDLSVGLLSALPYLAAAIAMVLIGRHSDRTRERRWHCAGPAFLAASGLSIGAVLHSPAGSLLALSVAAAGIWGTLGPFWTLPTAFLSGTAAAGGIALINSVGNLGGFLGPYLVGLLKESLGSFTAGFIALALVLCMGGILALRAQSRGQA